jgi:hypothetical protein
MRSEPLAGGEPVNVIRLDGLRLEHCHFIKIDVEGMELLVLQGASALIERFKPILYVENDRAQKSDALIKHLAAIGYRLHWHTPPLFNPQNFLKNPKNNFGNIVSANMLCLHRDGHRTVGNLRPVALSELPCGA